MLIFLAQLALITVNMYVIVKQPLSDLQLAALIGLLIFQVFVITLTIIRDAFVSTMNDEYIDRR